MKRLYRILPGVRPLSSTGIRGVAGEVGDGRGWEGGYVPRPNLDRGAFDDGHVRLGKRQCATRLAKLREVWREESGMEGNGGMG